MNDARRLDLNLLLAFEALMRTRSVTRAGVELGLGQPAMSAALKRLRKLCDDPLFVRVSTGLQPTPRADAMFDVVARALADLRAAVLASRTFTPETGERTFRIAASDAVSVALLAELLPAIRRAAPGVTVVMIPLVKDRIASDLLTSEIDLAIGHLGEPSGPLRTRGVYTDELVALFDAEACAIKPPISLDALCRLPHVMMSTRGDTTSVVDRALADVGRARRVLLSAPYFVALPLVLHGLAAIACVPRGLAETSAAVTGLTISPLPVTVPRMEIRMAWTERADRDPGLVWLRDQIVAAIGR